MPRSHPFTAHIPSLTNKEGILYDVVGVGNALVDMIAMVDDAFLASHEMVKGSMALIETDRAVQLSTAVGASTRTSGGSGANTIAGIASLGGDVAFIGKVADDEFGAVFAEDMKTVGVDFRSGTPDSSVPTGRCIIAVTPDAQRTMNTFLGISTQLSFSDLDAGIISAGAVLYLEGYLFDRVSPGITSLTGGGSYTHYPLWPLVPSDVGCWGQPDWCGRKVHRNRLTRLPLDL